MNAKTMQLTNVAGMGRLAPIDRRLRRPMRNRGRVTPTLALAGAD
jgi:hypothetical protein